MAFSAPAASGFANYRPPGQPMVASFRQPPPTAIGMMLGQPAANPYMAIDERSAIIMQQTLQADAIRAQDMADRERQASSLAAAGDVAARISLYRESSRERSDTMTTAGGDDDENTVSSVSNDGAEIVAGKIAAVPTADVTRQTSQVSGIGAALGVDSRPSNASRGVSNSSSVNQEMFNSLSELGEIDDIELDFSNMFANEQFMQAAGGGWVSSNPSATHSTTDGVESSVASEAGVNG